MPAAGRLVLAAGRRSLWRHPLQLILAVIGIAVGVAVVVAVDLANQSARQAMGQAVERVAGRATHQIVAGPGGLDEELYRELRVEAGLRRAAPVVEGGATLPGHDDRPLTLLGLDPFAEAPFRAYVAGGAGGDADVTRLLVSPGGIALSEDMARDLGVARGDELRLRAGNAVHRLTVTHLVAGGDRDLSGLAFGDIAAVQEWLGRTGELTRIDLILEPHEVAAVEARLPAGATLVPAASRGRALTQMSDAFHVNLTALSLLALLVGLFLVFNTMSFLVVQRRRMLGILRALGVTRAGVVVQVLADALLVGLLGTLLGLPLGVLLGTGVTDLVLATIDNLYFEAVGGLRLDVLALLKGGLLGLAGTVLAALPAVREAAGVAPRQSLDRADLERRARHGVKVLAVGGLVAALLGGLVLVLGSGLVAGFGGIFAVMMAFAAVVPLIVVIATRLLGRLPGAPLWWRLCVRGAGAAISRTGIAVAALTVAVAAVIGVSVMIDSFRASVADWLERTLQADFYVGAPSPMPPAVADRLGAVEGVDYVSRSRFARIPSAQGYTNVRGLALPRAGWSRFELVSGGRESAREAFLSGEGVLVSEPYARQNGVGLGDDVEPLVKGGEPLPIVGIFRDYASVKGVIVMPLATYRALFDDDQLTGVGVHLAAGVAPDSVRSRLAEALTGIAGARLQDNERIRARSLAVFDQTFRVTAVLRLLAGFVAIVGVLGSLMALQLDRAREYATYRALGLTRGQLGAMAFGESGVLGTLAGLCAMALGVLLAALLVFVINRRAFGWTMAFEVGPGPLVGGLALAIGAALVAAVYPAWSIARQSPAAGLKEE